MRTPLELETALKAQDGGPTFFNNAQFPWTRVVESHWAEMRTEADRVLAALELLPGIEELQVEQLDLTTDKRWKVFPFYAYGHWAQGNLRRCPATARAIREIPGLQAAMYSVFEPKKSIPVHRGVYGGMLRYHMGINVPKPETQCGITVGGDTRHWRTARAWSSTIATLTKRGTTAPSPVSSFWLTSLGLSSLRCASSTIASSWSYKPATTW